MASSLANRRRIGAGPAQVAPWAFALLLLLSVPARAEDEAPLKVPGIGAQDRRVRTDPNAAPWRAVGKLQANVAHYHMSCTGTLIGPALVLTAAHCVYNPLTRQKLMPELLHFLVGYNGDDYAGHAVGVSLTIGPGFDPLRREQTLGSDWALMTIDSALGTPGRVLGLRKEPPGAGTKIMIGGYSLDHPLVLMVDPKCEITGRAADGDGRPLLVENCAATRGVSGAPVLVAEGKGWRVGGIFVAAPMGVQTGVIVPLADIQARLGR